jgi:hypothetical protein
MLVCGFILRRLGQSTAKGKEGVRDDDDWALYFGY